MLVCRPIVWLPTEDTDFKPAPIFDYGFRNGKTSVVLHDVQLLMNKQQQIWGGVYIHWHFLSSVDTVVFLQNVFYFEVDLIWSETSTTPRSVAYSAE